VPTARASGSFLYHFFASSQRNGERKDAQAFPLGTPLSARQNCRRSRASNILAEMNIFRFCVGVLIIKRQHGRVTHGAKAKFFYHVQRTPVRTNFKQKRESKNSCQKQTHLRGGIYAPQMEDACKSKIPAVHRRNGGRRGGPGGNVRAPFFRHFLGRSKKWHKKAIRSARGSPRSMSVWLRTKQKNSCQVLRTRFSTNFKQKRESKNSCQMQTHLRGGIYAPQMEDACKSKIPAVHRRNGGRRGGPGGNVRAPFFRHFLGRSKKWHKKAIRAARRSRGGLYARM